MSDAATLTPPGRVAAPLRPGPSSRIWACVACGSRWGAWLSCCPRCKSELTQEDTMPKITRHAGATDKLDRGSAADDAAVTEPGPPVPALEDLVEVQAPADGTLSEPITGDGTGEPLPPVQSPERPAVRAGKDDWVTYAASLGLDPTAAEALNKNDLIGLCDGLTDGTLVIDESGQVVDAGVTEIG